MDYGKTKMYSILNNRCPHCHEGNYFKTDNFYDLKKFSTMNRKCEVCGEDFVREPGYYFGAAYVSYGLTVAFGIMLYLLLWGVFNFDAVPYLITFSTLSIALLPVFYRLARIIWINIFVSYNGK